MASAWTPEPDLPAAAPRRRRTLRTGALAQYDVEEGSRLAPDAAGRPARAASKCRAGPMADPARRATAEDATDSRLRATSRAWSWPSSRSKAGATLPWDLRAQLQAQRAARHRRQLYAPWLVEALVRKEWGQRDRGLGTAGGRHDSSFSLEHAGAAWSPERTISASALNSWLWEDISLAGLEGEWWRESQGGLRFGLLAGVGYGPDLFGRLLAVRGWVMGDPQGGINGDLPLPNGTRTDIFDERDDRPAAYLLASLGDTEERAAQARLFRQWRRPGGARRLAHAACDDRHRPSSPSERRRRPAIPGAARRRCRHRRTTATFEAFLRARLARPSATPVQPCATTNSASTTATAATTPSERATAFTAAYFYQWGLRHRIGLEHIWLEQPAAGGVSPELSSDGWQVSYRFRY